MPPGTPQKPAAPPPQMGQLVAAPKRVIPAVPWGIDHLSGIRSNCRGVLTEPFHISDIALIVRRRQLTVNIQKQALRPPRVTLVASPTAQQHLRPIMLFAWHDAQLLRKTAGEEEAVWSEEVALKEVASVRQAS